MPGGCCARSGARLRSGTLKLARSGRLEVAIRSEEIDRLRGEIRRANRRTVQAVIGAALLIGASVVLGLGGERLAMAWGAPVWTWVLGGTGVCLVLAAWAGGGEAS